MTPSQIDRYQRAALTEAEREAMESHLVACAICHDRLVELEIEEILPSDGSLTSTAAPQTPPSARRIGPYRLLHELGRGGQGLVYLAEDSRLPRRVALKVFHRDFAASDSVLLRFQREAAALSRLDHPGICTVYETGTWEGSPYIAMRYVEGEMLAQHIARNVEASQRGEAAMPERTTEIVCLIERVAMALHSAHQAGLIHRDIKPSNILIEPDGAPVIVDFGLARDEESVSRTLTRSGELAGTPVYMSPEQVRGERALVDRRSDVFSLGVTLHEALTLTLPFDAPTTAGVFQKILAGQIAEPAGVTAVLHKDLRVILATALESDRSRRYQTALAFAEDLRRWRKHEPILARPAGSGLRLRRWTQRNPVVAVSLLAVFLILATALGISITLLDRVRSESEARAAVLRREEGLRLAVQSTAVLEQNPGQALLLAIEAARRDPSLDANNALLGGLTNLKERARLLGHTSRVIQASFSRDGQRIVTASQDNTARVWDAGSGKLIAVASGHEGTLHTADLSPDGKRVLTAANDATARIWDAASGQEILRLSGHKHGVLLARFNPDGSRVLTIGRDTARIWDANTGERLHMLDGHAAIINCARFNPDGTCVVTGSNDRTSIVWDAISGKARYQLAGHQDWVVEARFSGSGKTIITSSADRTARIWAADSGQLISVLAGHENAILSAAIDATDDRAATGGGDFTARIWDVRTGKELSVLRHQALLIQVDLSRDGRRLLTSSVNGIDARVWDTASGELLTTLRGHAAPLQHAEFSANGDSVVTSSGDFTARLWSVHPSWPRNLLSGLTEAANLATIDSTAENVLVASQLAKEVKIHAASTGALKTVLSGHQDLISAIELSPDGQTVLTTSRDATARLWNLQSGELLHVLSGHTAWVVRGRFSADGQRVATSSQDRTVRVWDCSQGIELSSIASHQDSKYLCSLNRDGSQVICGAKGEGLLIANVESGQALRPIEDGRRDVLTVEWSPDGLRMAVACASNRVQIRDAATGKSLGQLVHSVEFMAAAYSPDGKWIATVGADWTTRIWDTRSLQEVLSLKEPSLSALSFSFAAKGGGIAIHGFETGQLKRIKGRYLYYPLDPLAEAMKWPGTLTPDERDQFRVGSIEERAAHRAAWDAGNAPGVLQR